MFSFHSVYSAYLLTMTNSLTAYFMQVSTKTGVDVRCRRWKVPTRTATVPTDLISRLKRFFSSERVVWLIFSSHSKLFFSFAIDRGMENPLLYNTVNTRKHCRAMIPLHRASNRRLSKKWTAANPATETQPVKQTLAANTTCFCELLKATTSRWICRIPLKAVVILTLAGFSWFLDERRKQNVLKRRALQAQWAYFLLVPVYLKFSACTSKSCEIFCRNTIWSMPTQ